MADKIMSEPTGEWTCIHCRGFYEFALKSIISPWALPPSVAMHIFAHLGHQQAEMSQRCRAYPDCPYCGPQARPVEPAPPSSEPESPALALFDGMFRDFARGIMHNEDDLPKLREAILAQERAHKKDLDDWKQIAFDNKDSYDDATEQIEQLRREQMEGLQEEFEMSQRALLQKTEERDAARRRIAFLRELICREGVRSDDARTRQQCFAALEQDDKAEKEGG